MRHSRSQDLHSGLGHRVFEGNSKTVFVRGVLYKCIQYYIQHLCTTPLSSKFSILLRTGRHLMFKKYIPISRPMPTQPNPPPEPHHLNTQHQQPNLPTWHRQPIQPPNPRMQQNLRLPPSARPQRAQRQPMEPPGWAAHSLILWVSLNLYAIHQLNNDNYPRAESQFSIAVHTFCRNWNNRFSPVEIKPSLPQLLCFILYH